MRGTKAILSAVITCLMLLAVLIPATVSAEGLIDTDRDVELSISYFDGDKPIHDAKFRVFLVANVDQYCRMTLTDTFRGYAGKVDGLDGLDGMDKAGWLKLANTLDGYVRRDDLDFEAEGFTDADGNLTFRFKPGLFLVLGFRATTDDFQTYTAVPFMVFLPDRDSANNAWVYETTAVAKFHNEIFPPDDDPKKTDETDEEEFLPKYVTRKVIKKWDDEGYESARPEAIEMQLLRDGEIFDTEKLTGENSWRFAWDNLESKYDWTVVEKEIDGYAVSIEKNGITSVITNRFVAPVNGVDPPVQKRIVGDAPAEDSEFAFVLKAGDDGFPMPENSDGGVKEMTIKGAGSREFGDITFTEPGVYTYMIYEKDLGLKGYSYDRKIYTITYNVTREDDELKIDRTITVDGKDADTVEFTNTYKAAGTVLPQTGLLWWPVPVLFTGGAVLIVFGVIRRRRRAQ